MKQKETRQGGFTLIEVLVATVVLSLGLLGLAGMQIWAVKNTGNAFFRTQATLAANDMVERMRGNPEGRRQGAYSVNVVGCGVVVKSCADARCTPAELAQDDLFNVACGTRGTGDHVGLDDLLPNGVLAVTCLDNCTVTVTWDEVNERVGNDPEAKILELLVTP